MEIILAIILSVSLLIPLLIIFLHQNSFRSSSPPGPPRVPFLGNLLQLDISCLHEYLWRLSERYGPLMSLKLGSIPVIVVSSARLAEEVMNNQDLAFCRRPNMLGQQRLTYYGLDVAFGAYNQEWREKRKIFAVHLLSVKQTLQFRPIREHEASRMVNIIRKDAELGNKVTNLSEIVVLITSSMICRTAFGKQIEDDDQVQEKRRFDDMLHDIQAMFVRFFFSDYFPSIGWMDNLTGMRSRLEKTFQKLDLYYQNLIDEHLDPERPASMDNDIIDIILQLQRDGSTSFQITMDHIKALVMDVFVGATETSACAVIWTMTALMKNPRIMMKVQAEIREAMGSKEMIEEDDIDQLPYFKAAVKESMRLYPVIPLMLRESREKCNLDGYEIPLNTKIYVNAWSISRDPEVWENPNDFSPDRFFSKTVDNDKHQVHEFGSGRRSCPGNLMGLSTVHLLASNLLYSFNWELPSGMNTHDIDTASLPGLVMSKKIDLQLVAKIP